MFSLSALYLKTEIKTTKKSMLALYKISMLALYKKSLLAVYKKFKEVHAGPISLTWVLVNLSLSFIQYYATSKPFIKFSFDLSQWPNLYSKMTYIQTWSRQDQVKYHNIWILIIAFRVLYLSQWQQWRLYWNRPTFITTVVVILTWIQPWIKSSKHFNYETLCLQE